MEARESERRTRDSRLAGHDVFTEFDATGADSAVVRRTRLAGSPGTLWFNGRSHVANMHPCFRGSRMFCTMPDEGMLFVGDHGKILAGFTADNPRPCRERDRIYEMDH